MKTSKQTLALVLSMALCPLSAAVAQELDGSPRHQMVVESASVQAATLAEVDRYLLEALQASDESARRVALGAAQSGTLDEHEFEVGSGRSTGRDASVRGYGLGADVSIAHAVHEFRGGGAAPGDGGGTVSHDRRAGGNAGRRELRRRVWRAGR